jgi:E3 SUMO-protein ligase RanBP2
VTKEKDTKAKEVKSKESKAKEQSKSTAPALVATPSFGGFTGNITKPFATPEQSTKGKTVDDKPAPPSPFANFTFGGGSTNKSFTELFSGFNNAKTDISVPNTTTAIVNNANISEATKQDDETEDAEHYEPTAQFEPVIPLPALIEVKTGEEDETVMFCNRAKLLRFDATSKEWKERGIGEMKVLVNKTDSSKARLLMRREQVHKLCCNMPITKELKFVTMTPTAVSFGGQDFSESEMQTEKLAIKFKTSELIKKFTESVADVQKKLDSASKPAAATAPAATGKVEEKKTESSKGFGDQFKPKAGSWSCEACYISNKPETLYCVACETPKDSSVPKKDAKPAFAPAADAPKFSFGMPNASGFSFGMPAATANVTSSTSPADSSVVSSSNTTSQLSSTSSGFAFGSLASSSTGFSFGKQATAQNESSIEKVSSTVSTLTSVNNADSTSDSGFTFGITAKPSFSFGNESKPVVEEKTPFVVQEVGKTDAGFNFVFKKKSPSKCKSPGKSRNDSVNSEGGEEDADENEYHEEEENQTHFTPAIPLPDKIDVKTGEEDEIVLYSHRSKLFRFTDKEWKERGIGDIKILKHSVTGKLR